MAEQEKLLTYYQRELSYLRNAGAQFARSHPKVARRLELGPNEAGDPHVERLIQSFAYLNARLQKSIDDYFPLISAALLDILYPQFNRPLPASTIVKFDISQGGGKLTDAAFIPRGTPLFAESQNGDVCRFSTCYDLELWPIKVTEANVQRTELLDFLTGKITTQNVLKIKLEGNGVALNTLPATSLRFYISGDRKLQGSLYEIFFTKSLPLAQVAYIGQEKVSIDVLPAGSVNEVGFHDDESLFPFPDNAFPAYRYLYEYFHFPQKFSFFDVQNLNLTKAVDFLELYFPIPETVHLRANDLNHSNFELGCTPAVNLFSKITEPIDLNHKTIEYRLVADYKREHTTEIFSVNRLFGVTDPNIPPKEYFSYFSFSHEQLTRGHSTFWFARRDKSERADIPGTDLFLTFVDYNFDPKTPEAETIYAETLCTNRELARNLSAGTLLQAETSLPVSEIYCLEKPSDPIRPPEDGETLWRLISHLSTNYLSLSSDPSSLKALKEILRMYAYSDFLDEPSEIRALHGMRVKQTVRRLTEETWRGFVTGLKITLEYDLNKDSDGNTFLLSTVLSHFFQQYVSVNSFAELEIVDINRKGIWKQWQPHIGKQSLL